MLEAADNLERVAHGVWARAPFLPIAKLLGSPCMWFVCLWKCIFSLNIKLNQNFYGKPERRLLHPGPAVGAGPGPPQRAVHFQADTCSCHVVLMFHVVVIPTFFWVLIVYAPSRSRGDLQDRNAVRLDAERLPVQQLANFRDKLMERSTYRLAAQLWAGGGMDWDEAVQVATNALEEVPPA